VLGGVGQAPGARAGVSREEQGVRLPLDPDGLLHRVAVLAGVHWHRDPDDTRRAAH
jgi:hypothetical protein